MVGAAFGESRHTHAQKHNRQDQEAHRSLPWAAFTTIILIPTGLGVNSHGGG
jgi:hypothetical protein